MKTRSKKAVGAQPNCDERAKLAVQSGAHNQLMTEENERGSEGDHQTGKPETCLGE